MLLAYKIWTVTRKSAQYSSNNFLTPVLRVIIESGAIYSMTITTALITFAIKSNGVYVVLDMVSLAPPLLLFCRRPHIELPYPRPCLPFPASSLPRPRIHFPDAERPSQ